MYIQKKSTYIEGILPKGPYLPCVSRTGRALLAGYHRHIYPLFPRWIYTICINIFVFHIMSSNWAGSCNGFFPRGKQKHSYSMLSIPWRQMTWQWKEPGHQQPLYWLFSRNIPVSIMPQSHQITDPERFLAPVRFLPESRIGPVGIPYRCCSRGHNRVGAPCGHTLMVWSNNSQDSTWTPCDIRTAVVRASHGNLRCFSYILFIRDPYGPVWDPQGCRMGTLRTRKRIDTTRIWKNPSRASYVTVRGPYPLRAVHELFTISKPVWGPWAYNACI